MKKLLVSCCLLLSAHSAIISLPKSLAPIGTVTAFLKKNGYTVLQRKHPQTGKLVVTGKKHFPIPYKSRKCWYTGTQNVSGSRSLNEDNTTDLTLVHTITKEQSRDASEFNKKSKTLNSHYETVNDCPPKKINQQLSEFQDKDLWSKAARAKARNLL